MAYCSSCTMSVAAHGIGTAMAFHENRRLSAFPRLAMALSGVFTTLPLVLLGLGVIPG